MRDSLNNASQFDHSGRPFCGSCFCHPAVSVEGSLNVLGDLAFVVYFSLVYIVLASGGS